MQERKKKNHPLDKGSLAAEGTREGVGSDHFEQMMNIFL